MADSRVDVTVAINAHREGRQLHPTLKSAVDACNRARSAGLACEILVILDNSDEDTGSYCSEFLPAGARLVEVSLRDLGLARNAAVDNARGEHVAFLDGDDLFVANWLEDAYRFMQADDRELVLHPQLVIYFEGRQCIWKLPDQEDSEFSITVLIEHNPWPALTFARKATYRATPFRPSALQNGFGYEDWLFNCDTIARGVIHKSVPGTMHCIREKSWKRSLLKETVASNSIVAASDLFSLPWQSPGAKAQS